jgi:uncharacterized membrane-anchored protein
MIIVAYLFLGVLGFLSMLFLSINLVPNAEILVAICLMTMVMVACTVFIVRAIRENRE